MKIFGTGMQRTGCTSLARAFVIAGFPTRQFPKELYTDVRHPVAARFDAFTDFPIPLLFRQLDEVYPGSKFVHTMRDEDRWIRSVEWLFSTGSRKFAAAWPVATKFHQAFYGTTEFDAPRFLERYRAYNSEVLAYFRDRPADFMTLNIEAGEGFAELCPFLGIEMPDQPFPHGNKRESLMRIMLRAWLKRLGIRSG